MQVMKASYVNAATISKECCKLDNQACGIINCGICLDHMSNY